MNLSGNDETLACEGHVDGWDGRSLRGWAWTPSDPAAVVTIEIVAQSGEIVAATAANIFRGDLANAGKRDGSCSFFLDVPFVDGGALRALARVDDAVCELDGSPVDYPYDLYPAAPAFDNRLSDGTGLSGYLDETGPHHFRGWVHDGTMHGPAIRLEIVEDDRCIASGTAELWREDVVDLRQGNGRVGYRIALPAELYDGAMHRLTLRRADSQAVLLAAPAEVRLEGVPSVTTAENAVLCPRGDRPIALSVVVNFYNMRREAARTLHSLSRSFQRDVEDIAYEVVCIDNGSDVPLDETFIEGFGPEFRLFRPAEVRSSPVFALNEAAASAKGEWLAIMIDGAHLLSPGAIAEAMAALRSRKGNIVALRQWFIGGDQRWLSTIGYSGTQEDILFSRIAWPHCGYDIFEISAPILESVNHWFDGMSETNCLFLSAEAFRSIGGFDEAFSMAGGGFANLDLFVRAARAPQAKLIALIGEASFHQYHGGTTTNVSDAEKDLRVRNYASVFEAVRGSPFAHLDVDEIEVRGRIRSKEALTARRPPNDRTKLGLSNHIRPSGLAFSFDRGAQSLLRAAYVEAGLHERSIWAGKETGVAPADLIEIQQMLWSSRPDSIVCKDVDAGMLDFVLSILPVVGLDAAKVIWVTHGDGETAPTGVCHIVGDPLDDRVRREIEDALGAAEAVCSLVQPRDDESLPFEAIRQYGRFVSAGSYLVVLGAAFGQPDIGYSMRWTEKAIERFLRAEPAFQRDHLFNAHLVTTCPSGFLRRIPDVHLDLRYNPALDDLQGA